MRKQKYHSETVKRLLVESKMATMVELKEAMGTNVDATIFRKLRELSYLRSYSHRGKYYTLPEVARFDEQGLWSYQSVHFSKEGSLLDTMEQHVDYSLSGYFEYELESLLHVGVRAAVLRLLKDRRIDRQKVSGRYLCCSARKRKRNRQLAERKKQQSISDSALDPIGPEVLFQEGKTILELFLSLLDEKQRRLYAGLESIKIGHGGDKKMARLFGMDIHTVAKGRKELWSGGMESDRIRRAGGGRKQLEKKPRKSSA